MNKTININLGGVFFHIDETAYKKLKNYLDAIRRSLSDDPKGKDEILTDIESRIGEILAENVKDVRQVVNEQDIDGIMDVMGKPEDYIGDEEFFDEHTSSSSSSRKSKKLYRDTNDKFLGGVSSGLAHYFGMDTIWVRLIWLVLFFSGGIGGLVYIVLWILLPEANSTAEKLEMEGEAVNISNIEKKIREEFTNASQVLKDGIDDVSEHIKKKNYQSKVKSGSQEIVSLFGRIFSTFFNIFGKFIGALLIFVAGITIVSLLFGLLFSSSVGIFGIEGDFFQLPIEDPILPLWLIAIFAILAIVIPFIALFMLGLRILSSSVKSFSRTTKLSLLGIWLISLVALAFITVNNGVNYANNGFVVKKHMININNSDVLNIKIIKEEDVDYNIINNDKYIEIDGKNMQFSEDVNLNFKESTDGTMYLKVYKKSTGRSKKLAQKNAEKLIYNFDLKDNNLLLDAGFMTEFSNRFGNKKVNLVLYLPKGKKIYLDKTLKDEFYGSYNSYIVKDNDNMEHHFLQNEDTLDCTDCPKEETEEDDIKSIKLKINDDGIDLKIEKNNKKQETEIKKDTIIKKIKSIKINKHVSETENGLEIN